LISVAKDLDVVGVDGNPHVLDKMLSLDRQRNLDYQIGNSSNTCLATKDPGMGLDEKVDQGAKDLTPTKTEISSVADHLETDQEQGWSKVGPRKKKKSKKK
jgi:hypothetical protein